MICPACHNDMIVVEYQRIELDFCPGCRGVWFDTGELDLILQSAKPETKSISEAIKLSAAQTNEKPRKCPICRRRMTASFLTAANYINW